MRIACHVFTLFFSVAAGASAADSSLTTQLVASGFNLPVFACASPGDTTRLFVIEQHTGTIQIIHLATGSTSAFMTISAATTGANVTQGSEQGLLGLAFHPLYATNGFFYVNYTRDGGGGAAGQTVIERFKATSGIADPASRTPILAFDQPESNHNGGWIGFGPDGFLYISAGDGGGANDQHGTFGNAQDRTSLLGKLLRIDVDSAAPYAIPPSNPYSADLSKRGEIWAFGLRNPFRCAFDRANGNLWIGDVGQNTREEVDFIPSGTGGLNFGWRPREGTIPNPNIPAETPVAAATEPVYDYPHTNGNISIIGGYVYRGTAIAGLQGTYFFTDFGGRHYWSFAATGASVTTPADRTSELTGNGAVGNVSSFGEDAAGEMYLCDYSNGKLFKIVDAGSSQPSVFTLSNMHATLNFKVAGRDSLSITGTVPALTGFDPASKPLILDVGGVNAVFTLDSKGMGSNALGTVSLKMRPGKPSLVRANLRGSFSPQWLDEGIDPATDAKKQDVLFSVALTLDIQKFQGTVHDLYSARHNAAGHLYIAK